MHHGALVAMSRLSLLPLQALPYSSVGDEAYQSSSHHIRKGQKGTHRTFGLAESKSCLWTVYTANMFEAPHGMYPSQVCLEKRFRRAWTAHGAVQFSSLSPSEI